MEIDCFSSLYPNPNDETLIKTGCEYGAAAHHMNNIYCICVVYFLFDTISSYSYAFFAVS